MDDTERTSTVPHVFAFTAETSPQQYFEYADALVLHATQVRERAEQLQQVMQALHLEADNACESAEILRHCGSLERESAFELLNRLLEIYKDVLPRSKFTNRDIEEILTATEEGLVLVSEVEAFGSQLEAFSHAQIDDQKKKKLDESYVAKQEKTTSGSPGHKLLNTVADLPEGCTAGNDTIQSHLIAQTSTPELRTSLDLTSPELIFAILSMDKYAQGKDYFETNPSPSNSKRSKAPTNHAKQAHEVHQTQNLQEWVQSNISDPGSARQQEQGTKIRLKKKGGKRKGKGRGPKKLENKE